MGLVGGNNFRFLNNFISLKRTFPDPAPYNKKELLCKQY